MSRSGRFTHRVDRYAEAVLDGGIVAGPYVRLACERHFRDRERAAAGGWFQFSEAFADQILDFYEGVLRLPDLVDELGDPQPFRLDVGSGFWAFVLGSGFGLDAELLRFDLAPNGKPHGAVPGTVTKPKSALEKLQERRKGLHAVGGATA